MGLFKMLFPKMAKELEEMDRKSEAKKNSDINSVEKNKEYEQNLIRLNQKRDEFLKNQEKTRKRKKDSINVWTPGLNAELDRKIQKNDIAQFLERKGVKLPASDIDFQLKIGDVDLVKELCEEMYRDKRIGRTGNYRYFV